MYEAPLRFLGLRLDACGLKHMNVPASDFRNNLYRTGLHEAFIDELKLDSNCISRQELVRKLLERITLLFVDDNLATDWFSVFQEHLHPPHVRNNLTQGRFYRYFSVFLVTILILVMPQIQDYLFHRPVGWF